MNARRKSDPMPRSLTSAEIEAVVQVTITEAKRRGAQTSRSAGCVHVRSGPMELTIEIANFYSAEGLARDVDRLDAVVRALRQAAPRASV